MIYMTEILYNKFGIHYNLLKIKIMIYMIVL